LRICIIGKYPPIQGGVSMRTYWRAHGLAALGHEVHVVTNAKEAVAPYRVLMRGEDWERCTGKYNAGSVTVHWTAPVDASQSYIPMASPFVSKLAGIAARVVVLASDGGRDGGGDWFPTLDGKIDLSGARKVLAAIESAIATGDERARPLLAPVQVEIAVAMAEDDIGSSPDPEFDPLFRLHTKRWAADDDDLLALFPVRDPQARLIAFDVDVSIYLRMPAADALSKMPPPGRSFLVAFAQSGGARRESLIVDETVAEILEICDGTRTVFEMLRHGLRHRTGFDENAQRGCIVELLTAGLVFLQDRCIDRRVAPAFIGRIEVRSSLRTEVHA
jgi:hypothetical protein